MHKIGKKRNFIFSPLRFQNHFQCYIYADFAYINKYF